MEYKEATAILCDIEANVAVERLRYRGLAMWPLARLALWRQFAGGVVTVAEAAPSRWQNLLSQLRLAMTPSQRDYPRADAMFLVAEDERRYGEIDGKRISPFVDSLREDAERIGLRSVTFDSSGVADTYGAPLRLDRDTARVALMHKLHARLAAPGHIAGFAALKEYLGRAHPAVALDEAAIATEADYILKLKVLFARILEGVSPKAVFFTCYYQPNSMACILAARERGIRAVDIQHGQQGDDHGMYANWSKPPRGGYELLPDIFWCWGEQSAERINRWSRPVWPVHKGVVGGNPWMARQIAMPGPADQEAALDAVLKPGATKVLLALQPIEDALPQGMLDAIAASSDVQWLVRLHPMMRGGREAEIRDRLRATGNRNIEMEVASSVLLASILRRMDFVVTLWSSVAYEALLFGAHPVIAHPNGLKTFGAYIDNGLFSFAASGPEILDIVKRDKASFSFHEDAPYIETRSGVITEKLKEMTRGKTHA
jgi:hypothetical protein